GKTARHSYLETVARNIGMEWEQTRACREFRGTILLEQLLNRHGKNAIFCDESPYPADINPTFLEGTAYGNHSFLRGHQLIEENGTFKLHSRAIRHYLNLSQQEKAFSILSGQSISREELL